MEYLVKHGMLGELGRFRPSEPLACRRGDRVILRTARGVEIGEVLSEASDRLSRMMADGAVGTLLRTADENDRVQAERMLRRASELHDAANRLASEKALPLSVLDAEVLLDGERAALLFVRWQACDVRPFVSTLSQRFGLQLSGEDATREEPHSHGCGDCGSGGCGSGGCGTCGSMDANEVQAYFAGLREQMMAHNRVPLL
jgi:cell fate regulator YaaT (PSP1 superfamily)